MKSMSQKLEQLAADMRELGSATASIGWDKDPDELVANPSDLGARPIPKNEWTRAFLVASALAQLNPHLDTPVPGADPEGFVWLTWSKGTNGVALEIRKGLYKWTQRDGESKKTIQSDSLEDVNESLRTVLRPRS